MRLLVLGLVLFIGIHSIRIVADGARTRAIERLGLLGWKGVYSIVAIAGFVLIAWGYGAARADPVVLWTPPVWTRHLVALFTLIAFILIAAAYVPQTRIKSAVGHPMVAGTLVWAIGHLFANGTLADVALFGAFLVWAVFDFMAARRRDRASGTRYPGGPLSRDIAAVAAGLVVFAVFAVYLHGPLIGVRPF